MKNSKPAFFNKWIFIIIFSVLTIFVFLKLRFPSDFTENMMFWFFSATAQSMAALFAVGGVFAVFRFQAQENKLRNLYDTNKKRFSILNWQAYIADIDTEFWTDSEFLEKSKKILEKNPKNSIKQKIQMIIIEIEKEETLKKNILKNLKIPMVAILLTFLISIISLSLTEILSKNIIGNLIILIEIALIIFSIISTYEYINFSISFKDNKTKKQDINEKSGSPRP